MKREIKFRAYDKKKKEWILGYEMPNLGGFSMYGENMLLGEWQKVLEDFVHRDNFFEDLDVMQYIGVEDSNGNSIYEGDIVRWGGREVKHICEVRYVNDYECGFIPFCGLVGTEKPMPEYCDVIGNIYENPEILSLK